MSRRFRDALILRLAPKGSGQSGLGKPNLRQVAEGSGVSYEQLKKLIQRKDGSTNVEDAVKIAGFFGQTVEEFLSDSDALIRSEIDSLYNLLTHEEKVYLQGVARGLRARHLLEAAPAQAEHHEE